MSTSKDVHLPLKQASKGTASATITWFSTISSQIHDGSKEPR
jgi:hypothetical protein